MRPRRLFGSRASRYSPTAGLPFDDEELESRLVWIWTSARSGSTWFLRLLTHPLKLVDSRHDPNDLLGFRAPPTWQGAVDAIPVDTTFVANHLVPLRGGADYDENWSPITFSYAMGIKQRGNYFFSPKYEDAWRPELRRMMLVRFHRLIERTAERHRTADPLVLLKEVAGAHGADLVMSLFPRSRMIFLVRDGRDVVDSQTAANEPGGWLPIKGFSTEEERLEFVRRRSRTWVGDMMTIGRAFDAHPAELRRMVHYEDLLSDTAGTLRPIVEWLGLPRHENWLERTVEVNAFEAVAPENKGPTKFFRSATPGAWRHNMSPPEQEAMTEVMGDKLVELGYSLEVEAPAIPEGPPSEQAGSGGEQGAAPASLDKGARLVGASIQAAARGRDLTGVSEVVYKRGSAASRERRQVALTFDDGPVLATADALDTFARFDAKATFFVVGRKIPGHEELLRRILREGHEIGNHSFGHAAFPDEDDVALNTALIEATTGVAPSAFRPPYGAVDRPGALSAGEAGMRVVLWTIDSKDVLPPWTGIAPEAVHDNVVANLRPGSIVLMHDGQAWSRAVEALPAILESLRERDLEPVTVSTLLDTAEGRLSARRLTARIGRRRRSARRPARQR